MRLHLVVPLVGGPIPSGPGPELPSPEVKNQLGRDTVGLPDAAGCVVACDPTIQLSEIDRATGEWWAVACPRCKQTEAYKRLAATTPNLRGPRPAEPEFET